MVEEFGPSTVTATATAATSLNVHLNPNQKVWAYYWPTPPVQMQGALLGVFGFWGVHAATRASPHKARSPGPSGTTLQLLRTQLVERINGSGLHVGPTVEWTHLKVRVKGQDEAQADAEDEAWQWQWQWQW